MRTALRKKSTKSTLAVAAVAALALSLTACNDGSGTKDSGAADSGNSATAPAEPGNSAEPSDGSGSTGGTPAAEGDKNDTGSSDSGGASQQDGTGTGADGEGINTGGGEGTYTGTLTYLADHEMMVGDQAFLVEDSTAILGAAAICGAPDGSVTADNTGAGTTKCTYDDLVKAAKGGTVKVKVLKDPDGIAVKVAEIYHP